MLLFLCLILVLVVAFGVIRAAAKVRLDELAADLDDAWRDVDSARAARRALVGELIPLLPDAEGPAKRVVDTVVREHDAAGRAATPSGVARTERRLVDAAADALALAESFPDLAGPAAELVDELADAGERLADACTTYNRVVAEIEETGSSFPGTLVASSTPSAALDLGHELTAVRRRTTR